MITSLRLINFKAFENQLLQFKPLTLLSGLNSTGKSSVLQSLLLLRQSYKLKLLDDRFLTLNGPLLDIGTAQDAFCEIAKSNQIEFELELENNILGKWCFLYDINHKESSNLRRKELKIDNTLIYNNSPLFNKGFQYLEAERIGPRRFNEMLNYQIDLPGQLGTKGEYTAHFLYLQGREPIKFKKLSHPAAKSMDLIDQVEAWMREISPGIRIEIQASAEIGIVNIQYFYGESNRYRSTNVGFGVTYSLPIIVSVLSANRNSLILIENPEAHLHPQGQAMIGELLANAASCGIQVVIETHSDHVLNGIRLAVHSGKIKPEDVQLHYFQRQEKQGEAVTEVISPRIYRDGTIDRWPDGFFDEWERSLDGLLEPVEGD